MTRTEADIIEKLDSVPNKAGYIKELIRRDIGSNKSTGHRPERKTTMYCNDNGKFTSAAEYFYNEYIGMYCIIGTTMCAECITDLIDRFESPDLLTEVPIPDYITEDYDEPEW